MVAETDLGVLLKNLNPVASSEDYVFTNLPADSSTSTLISVAKGMFQEREGTTLILPSCLFSFLKNASTSPMVKQYWAP